MSGQLDGQLAIFVESLHRDQDIDVDDSVTRIVEFATTAATVTDGSIFVAHPTPAGVLYDTVVPTSPEVVKVDDLQHEVQQGPSLDAIAGDETVLCADLSADDRWPDWSAAAAGMGIHGVISARLRARGRTIGALNVYAREPGILGDRQARTIEDLAKHAAAALAAAADHTTLTRALLSRSAIGRSQGLLMERYGLDDGQAFDLLKRCSQTTNTKLRDIAERVLGGEALESILPQT